MSHNFIIHREAEECIFVFCVAHLKALYWQNRGQIVGEEMTTRVFGSKQMQISVVWSYLLQWSTCLSYVYCFTPIGFIKFRTATYLNLTNWGGDVIIYLSNYLIGFNQYFPMPIFVAFLIHFWNEIFLIFVFIES